MRLAHLPAYAKHGLNVARAYDPNPAATAGVREEFGVRTVFESLDDLVADPAIAIVDVATHAVVRPPIVHAALAAGKHVLAQKPLGPDLAAAHGMVEDAARRGLMLAVNQNGRWTPPWRVGTLLLQLARPDGRPPLPRPARARPVAPPWRRCRGGARTHGGRLIR